MYFLNIKGQKTPFKVSYYALKKFQEETGQGLAELPRLIQEDLKNMEILIYHGLVAGHKAADIPMEIKKDDVQWLLDDDFSVFMEAISSEMGEDGSLKGKKKL